MSVRGIEPSYFAGMPTVQRDPRAGQVDAGYAAMPGQALSEAAAMRQRQREFDTNQAFRAREQGFQEEQGRASAARDDRRLAMYQQGEDRRQAQQQFENDRLKAADTRKLVEAMQAATNAGETGIAEAIAAELQSRGWDVKPIGAQAAAGTPPAAASAAPAAPGEPEKGTSAGIANALRRAVATPVGPVTPEGVAGGRIIAATRGGSAELDGVENEYLGKLRPARSGLLPGSRLRTRAVQSDQLLSADDPYNQIVK